MKRDRPGDLCQRAYGFHGYGESVTDYNDANTRVGVGFALSRGIGT